MAKEEKNEKQDDSFRLLGGVIAVILLLLVVIELAAAIPKMSKTKTIDLSDPNVVINLDENPEILQQIVAAQEEKTRLQKEKEAESLQNLSDLIEQKEGSGMVFSAGENSEIASLPIDIDMSKLTEAAAYDEVSRIIESPMEYVGKNIKISGTYHLYFDGVTGKTYPNCTFTDRTGMNMAGMEFSLKEGQTYPADGSFITVSGHFDVYEEDGDYYCALLDADLLEEIAQDSSSVSVNMGFHGR